MVLTSRITAHDKAWPTMFLDEKARLAGAFGDALVAIHHVGSTAVPGLSAKPEIDMLVEVSAHPEDCGTEEFLRACGYVRGKDLSAGHHFYRRDAGGVRTHKVHVCSQGHPQIERMLKFRDLLRTDPAIRRSYQELKLRLEAGNRDGIKEYLARKAPFIDSILEAAS